MTRIKDWLTCLALGLLCALLALGVMVVIEYGLPVARNLRTASESLPTTMNSVKESADTANMVSTESLDLVGSMTKLVDAVGQTNTKAGNLLDAGTNVAGKYGRTADVLSARIDALAVEQAKADALMDAISTMPPHLNQAADNLAEDEDTFNRLLNDPITIGAIENVNALALNSATIVAHTDSYFFPPPYKGAHPIRHKIGRVVEYGLKLAPGLAGGIAIAKGN